METCQVFPNSDWFRNIQTNPVFQAQVGRRKDETELEQMSRGMMLMEVRPENN